MNKPIWARTFEEIYTPAQRSDFSRLLRMPSDVLKDEFKDEIFFFAWESNSRFCRELKVPSRKQLRSSLGAIEHHTRLLLQALRDFKPHAKLVLQYVPGRIEFFPAKQILGQPFSCLDPWEMREVSGYISLQELHEALAQQREWLGRSGPTTDANRLWAARELLKIWNTYAKDEPKLSYNTRTKKTSGPILEFCEVALSPATEASGKVINLERTIRDMLYGRVQRARVKGTNP